MWRRWGSPERWYSTEYHPSLLHPPDADIVAVLRSFFEPALEHIQDILLGVGLVVRKGSYEPVLFHSFLEFLVRHLRKLVYHITELLLADFPESVGGIPAVTVVSAVVVIAELANDVVQRFRVIIEAVGIAILDFVLLDNCCSQTPLVSF